MPEPRRTQADRRAETRASVLACATRLFGEHGYADTSLEQIAAEAGMTIRPVYHYFESKRGLFEAVTEALEARLTAVLRDPGIAEGREGVLERFRSCLAMLADPSFQRVVLVDAPNVLGRARWRASPVSAAASEILVRLPFGDDPVRSELIRRMLLGALTEAALALAESESERERDARIEALLALASVVLVGS